MDFRISVGMACADLVWGDKTCKIKSTTTMKTATVIVTERKTLGYDTENKFRGQKKNKTSAVN